MLFTQKQESFLLITILALVEIVISLNYLNTRDKNE